VWQGRRAVSPGRNVPWITCPPTIEPSSLPLWVEGKELVEVQAQAQARRKGAGALVREVVLVKRGGGRLRNSDPVVHARRRDSHRLTRRRETQTVCARSALPVTRQQDGEREVARRSDNRREAGERQLWDSENERA